MTWHTTMHTLHERVLMRGCNESAAGGGGVRTTVPSTVCLMLSF